MCRFIYYLGAPIVLSDLVTEPENSLIHQSFSSEEREEPLNGDGFGIAWYMHDVSPNPGVFRSLSPAWSNHNLHQLARITRTHCALAHVRAASENSVVAEANCHPFSSGPIAFMHNGDLAGYQNQRRRLLAQLSDQSFEMIAGTTDSEFIFAYFLDRLREIPESGDAAERLAQALATTIRQLIAALADTCGSDKSYLNIVVADGHHAVASRFTTDEPENAESLHMHRGKVYRFENGVSRLTDPVDSAEGAGAIIVASERLSHDATWETVPGNHMVIVQHDRVAKVRPLTV